MPTVASLGRILMTMATFASAEIALAQPQQQPQQPYPPPQHQQPQQPYPQQGYPPPGYPPPAYYPQPYGHQPPPVVEPAPRTGDLEIIADFAGLGILGSIALIDARDLRDEGTGTLLVMAGAASGAGVGYMLSENLRPSRADGHATTMGLTLGMLNGALLLVPLGLADSSEEVLPTLLAGGTAGALGGLAIARGMNLTAGQATFATNLSLLGLGTSALVGALVDQDGELDGSEMTTLLIGLDGGAAAGILLAPRIDWSYRRARMVGIASMIGFMSGSLIATAISNGERTDGTASGDPDPDAIAGGLLAGMWGGFLIGAKLSSDWDPDPKFGPRKNPVAIAPLATASTVGVSIGGSF